MDRHWMKKLGSDDGGELESGRGRRGRQKSWLRGLTQGLHVAVKRGLTPSG